MKSVLAVATAGLSLMTANPAGAALGLGATAPNFTASGALAGKAMTVDLAAMLAKGPVVLFFFPSAFTDGPECRAFADEIGKFQAAGASVLGMSRDSADTLVRFSADECGGKFPVASAPESLVNAFDVNDGAMFNTRTTFVIAPSGKIVFMREDENFSGHVAGALAALKK